MSSNQAIIDELSEMENMMRTNMKIIEQAYDAMESKLGSWNEARREILKSETKKALHVLSERDLVRFL